MKVLHAVRLVQWYHWVDETFALGGNCLLLGDNGSGKSTVLDAIQVALVGDLGQVRFNQAANERSERSLYGYVRYKLGSEDEGRPGQLRFARGSCTSWVLLEFRDRADPPVRFVCGLGFEASEADSDVTKLCLVVPDVGVDDIPVVREEKVAPLREMRAWLKDRRAPVVGQDVGIYREEIRQRLGVLPESFHRLIVKALSFKPIGRVRQFVFDYLLDARPVDTAALQANLEHYKRLEGEVREAERRIAALDAIVGEGERIGGERRTAESHRFMELRADHEAANARRDELTTEAETSRAELDSVRARAQELTRARESLERELDQIAAALNAQESFRLLREIERTLEDLGRNIERAEAADREARVLLRLQQDALSRVVSNEARDLRRLRPELFAEDEIFGASDLPAVVARLQETLALEGALAGRDLVTWTRRLERLARSIRDARAALDATVRAARREGAALQDEQRVLEAGRHRYPVGVEALLHLLRTRLKGRREPKPLCELVEIANDRWRDAVEGYLSTRRFDVIVAPEDYPRALTLYERNKRDYALPGRAEPVFISNVGLADLEKIERLAPKADDSSLARQVETTDPLARLYCDYVLGDVTCVDNEQELRRHRAAITDGVMVYRSHVARQTSREVFAKHYIGEAARTRRLAEIALRLAELSALIADAGRDHAWLGDADNIVDRARLGAAQLPRLVADAAGLARLRAERKRLEVQRQQIDLREVEALQRQLESLRAQRSATDTEKETLSRREGELEERLKGLAGAIADAVALARSAEADLAAFSSDLDRASLEARYSAERAKRRPEEIHAVFEKQRRTIETRVSNMVLKLVSLKTSYSNQFGFAGDVDGDGWADFAEERTQWQDSSLPRYREKISEAKQRALEQLAEDVIHRLRENLESVRRQIDDLNRALKGLPFGGDQYQFTVEIDRDHRAFHDLIMEAGRFEKDSLFGNPALEAGQARATLEDLLNRLVEGEARDVKSELEARADYREYFRYDLKILHADGTHSMFDRVSGDKSGGETQTPYYIAILASMYRLYCTRSIDGNPTCGLVLLDEAFGKMDENRIGATLAFARKLSLQLVLATPKERSELVAPRVDRSLYIHKDVVSGEPLVLDFTKEFAKEGEIAGDGSAPDDALGSA